MHPGPRHRSPRSRLLGAALAAVLLGTVVAACSSGGSSAAAGGPDLGTIDPGVIKVAYEPYAPYTSLEGDQLTGLDADILNAAAQKLNLKVTPVETDFPGMLASVQARRVDITIGGVAWTAARQKQGLFTDPPYYSPPAMAVRQGESFSSVGDLQGRSLGTVEGYVWVDSIKQIPGANLHVYPDAASAFSDLGSGRIDGAFLDPLIIIAAQRSGANDGLNTIYLTPPTAADVAAHPAYSYFQPYMTGFYMPSQETKLQAALNEQINAMYKDGTLSALITKYGGDPAQFLKPSPDMSAQRHAVDRPAGWTPPSL
jgi:polar amino acid transport system substrate-binding protein